METEAQRIYRLLGVTPAMIARHSQPQATFATPLQKQIGVTDQLLAKHTPPNLKPWPETPKERAQNNVYRLLGVTPAMLAKHGTGGKR